MVQLSIIIPTYKRNESLFRILGCLQNQKDILLQIIVVDQNKENFFTENELQELSKFEHIKQIKPNVSAARNLGFQHAKSKYVLFIDDDLVPENDFCKKGVQIFLENELVKAYAPLVYGYEDKEELKNQFKKNYIKELTSNHSIYQLPETISACLFFEKEYFFATGGFDPILFDYAKSTEDQELFKRMQARGLEFWHVPFIEIFHDDKTTGGCDLRSEDYWQSRQKFMKGWVYRYMMHHNPPGILSLKDKYKMLRSAFLNKQGLKNGLGYIIKQNKLLQQAIKETKLFLSNSNKETVQKINFFI